MECYLYCIIESKKQASFDEIGIGGKAVYTINYKDLSAVVSDQTETKPVEVLKEGITHEKVIEAVMKEFTVIPLRFGQIPKNKEEIKAFLSDHYDPLKDLFKKIEGNVELGVKASWRMDTIVEQIVASNDRIRILQKQIKPLPAEKSYMLKIELGKLVADDLKARGEALAEGIFNSLKALAVSSKMNDAIGNKMVLNAAFLVSKEKERQFDEAVNTIEKGHPELMIKYVAAPPFNFVSLGEENAPGG